MGSLAVVIMGYTPGVLACLLLAQAGGLGGGLGGARSLFDQIVSKINAGHRQKARQNPNYNPNIGTEAPPPNLRFGASLGQNKPHNNPNIFSRGLVVDQNEAQPHILAPPLTQQPFKEPQVSERVYPVSQFNPSVNHQTPVRGNVSPIHAGQYLRQPCMRPVSSLRPPSY